MRVAAIAFAIVLPSMAAAQDRPPLTPTRDVGVTYRLTGTRDQGGPPGTGPMEMRWSWLNAEQKLRMDLPGGIGWSVMDQRARRAFMVMEQQRMVMDLPQGGPGTTMPGPGDSARFTRGGTATILGQPCNLWRYQDGADNGEACVTADGVMLRVTGTSRGQTGGMEATEVAYGPQDPARFRPPSGYQTMQMPSGAGRPPGR